MNNELRIIDANYNRCREGLRVMEEYCRFIIDNEDLTARTKVVRHELSRLIDLIPAQARLQQRNTPGDVGTAITLDSEASRQSLFSVLTAATCRVSEALRAIEEFAKISYPIVASGIEQLRYQCYDLEKMLFASFQRRRVSEVALYVILTEEYCRHNIIDTAKAVLAGGADCIQYRQKEFAGQQTLDTTLLIAELCREFDALFIVNDRSDLALASRADGVHLGQDDLPPLAARSIMGQFAILGRTCHNLDEVAQARHENIDYIGIGSIFGSATKPSVPQTGTDFISAARKLYQGAIVAIGGVTADNAALAINAGADAVCVCQAITAQDDPRKATESIKSVLKRNKHNICTE
ncbi:MAG: thiamine phosphate synthase [Sedimentisphaerales bacterium]|nr:thiamine phosphate synthase [Sedimentisphaerales bacterium]MBN2844172.1 thiamine phosphate synthase [Sedimentisphaerales bacterium]